MTEIKNYIPIRECKYEVNEGIVTVIFDKFEKSWLDKIIKPKKEKIARIELDEIGSFVWLSCDSKNKVKNILDLTKQKFSNSEDIENRVILYLNQLQSKKFIRFYTIK